MGVKNIYLVHYLTDRYGKMIETDLKKNHKRFYEALDITMPIVKCFEEIDNCIQYADDGKQPYTADHIINNAYNTLLNMGLYKEPIKMQHKNIPSVKTWYVLK